MTERDEAITAAQAAAAAAYWKFDEEVRRIDPDYKWPTPSTDGYADMFRDIKEQVARWVEAQHSAGRGGATPQRLPPAELDHLIELGDVAERAQAALDGLLEDT